MKIPQWGWLIGLAVVCILGLIPYSTSPEMPRKIRVGYINFQPYMITSPDHIPRGLVIDTFNEVARRKEIQVEWVDTSGKVEESLASGVISVYPFLLRTPDRMEKFAISEAWWELTPVLVSRDDDAVRTKADLAGSKVSLFSPSYSELLFRKHFPNAIQLPVTEIGQVLQPLCDGTAKAALADSRNLNLLLQKADRPCPGLDFHVQSFPQLTLRYGVGTRLEDKLIGAELQSTLLDMTMDGTMNKIGAGWNIYATNQIGVFRDLIRIKNQRCWLVFLISLLILVLMGVARLYYKMREARRAAVSASVMQGQFLANMSHEIRTPLNGVLGMSQLLSSTPLNHTQLEYVGAISSSGEVLLTLVNDCLDLARIEAGKFQLESIDVSVETLVERVVLLLFPKAKEKGLSIAAYIDPAIPEIVQGDPTRIQQILLNLVGNAIKFTQQGEIWIEVRRTSPGMICFLVEDTGAGIPVAAWSTLFDRFTQADASTTRQHGGNGLGLAICRDLVHLMGGKLGYEPRAEGGSRFWFNLSIAPQPERERSPLGRRVRFATSDPCGRRLIERVLQDCGCSASNEDEGFDVLLASRQLALPIRQSQLCALFKCVPLPPQILQKETQSSLGLNVLVAEDNAVNQHLILTFLKKLGCKAQLVENGELAVEAALQNDFDVILMDYQMPVLDGISAASRIRAAGGRRGAVPILAITAGVLSIAPERILAAGINGMLVKPYSLNALRDKLSTIQFQSKATAAT